MIADLPKTDFTRTIEVNVYDAKMFMAEIQTQMETCEVVGNQYEADQYRALLYKAEELLNVNEKL